MKFIKEARTWRSISGTQTFFWPLTPPPPVYYQPATKQRLAVCVFEAESEEERLKKCRGGHELQVNQRRESLVLWFVGMLFAYRPCD